MPNKSFYIKTFGCQMNERDSEIIAQSLFEKGYNESFDINTADLIIINTCSIRAKAEQKVMSLLGMLKQEKRRNENIKICVAGCVAQQEGQHLIDRMPHVDLVVGTQHIYDIPGLLEKSETNDRVVTSMSKRQAIPRYLPDVKINKIKNIAAGTTQPFKKFVTIMQGCNNYCTYCVVPYTRGREISRKKNDIIDEIKVLVDTGIREITLLGQNVNSYGLVNSVTEDRSPYSFPSLIQDVANISGLQRIRFTTSHPKDLSEDLMRCFRDIPILCHQIHLPVQSGSDTVLNRMNRRYTIADYQEKVEALRSYCPDIAISTDIIVGFPGETDDDFEQTMILLDQIRYDASFSFKYSDRPGTKSSEYPDKVPNEVKSRRLSRFQARQNEISLEKNNAYVGKSLMVMIEDIGPGGIQGRSQYNHIVHLDGEVSSMPGDMIEIFIYHAGQHSLRGKVH